MASHRGADNNGVGRGLRTRHKLASLCSVLLPLPHELAWREIPSPNATPFLIRWGEGKHIIAIPQKNVPNGGDCRKTYIGKIWTVCPPRGIWHLVGRLTVVQPISRSLGQPT